MSKRELRVLEGTEVRAIGGTGDADPLRIEGYAAVFNRSAKLPGFEERIKPGAFQRSIENNADVVCLWNHNSDIVLGRTTAGTLRLNQDSRGLHYVCDLPNTQAARDYHESIRRGDVNGCSFGFIADKKGQEWSEGRHDDGTYFVQRELTNFARLTDVSPVTYPAYEGTALSARSSAEVPAELRSAVDAKNAALVVTPPADLKEKVMSKFEFRAVTGIDGYNVQPQDCPASWSDEVKKAYCDGYNAAFDAAREAGLKGNPAIAKAVSGGMMGIHEMLARPDQSGSEQVPGVQADTDLDNDAKERAKKIAAEKRDDSIEDFLADMNAALNAQFPVPSAVSDVSTPCNYYGSCYWLVETFEDHVIVAKPCPGDSEYFAIPYVIDGEDNITFGTPTPVEKNWVASDRAAALVVELRDMNEDNDDEGDDTELGDTDLGSSFDAYMVGRHHDGKFGANHSDDMDCEDGDCSCQNRFCPTGSMTRSALPEGMEIRFADDFKFEARSGMTRTKHVAGKDLSAASFAYIGAADKTETWKFPIFDAAHVRNALSRWGQAKGIPDGSKTGVLAKIHAAAKKFGIEVADDSRTALLEMELRNRIAEHMLRVGPEFKVVI